MKTQRGITIAAVTSHAVLESLTDTELRFYTSRFQLPVDDETPEAARRAIAKFFLPNQSTEPKDEWVRSWLRK